VNTAWLSVSPVTAPRVLQIDTTTVCNLSSCIYCNPHGVGWASAPESMPTWMIEGVLQEAAEFGTIFNVRPYVNGDPLCEPRMHEILELCKKHLPKARRVLYSNGADFSRIDRITDPLLDELHISVSAATRETYLRVHGKPLFDEVVKTYREALRRDVDTYVHYIACKQNRGELDLWRRVFCDAKQNVSDLHSTGEQTASHGNFADDVPGTTMNAQKTTPNCACNGWNALGVGVHGEIMQCCDSNYCWNYGLFPETSLKAGWRLRIKDGLAAPPCQDCNLRSPNWRRRVQYTQVGAALTG